MYRRYIQTPTETYTKYQHPPRSCAFLLIWALPSQLSQRATPARLSKQLTMAAEKIHLAMDLKEATSLKDPFSEHLVAPDKEELIELEKEVEGVFESPKPNHDKIEKLLTMQSSLGQHAHVKCTPEDGMWREEMNEAVNQMESTA